MSSLLLFSGCAAGQSVLAAAAADLAGVRAPLAEAFRKQTGREVKFVLGSSGLLARQIEQGAPYDVYLSANEKFVTDLAAAGKLVAATVRVYAHGRLGLYSKDGSIRSLADLRADRVRYVAIANPAHAPYGVAAKQALEKQGLGKDLERRIVYGENVRQALEYAESGNAQAAITAWSLVFDRGGILLPEELHLPIRQAGGVVAASKQQEAARQFLEFLTSAEGARILTAHGLTPSGAPDRKPPSGR